MYLKFSVRKIYIMFDQGHEYIGELILVAVFNYGERNRRFDVMRNIYT